MAAKEEIKQFVNVLCANGYGCFDELEETKKILEQRLKELQDLASILHVGDKVCVVRNGETCYPIGICEYLDDYHLISYAMRVWGEEYDYYSGSESYPVSSDEYWCEEEAFCNSLDMWHSEYGRRRGVLVEFLIDKLRHVVINFPYDLTVEYDEDEYTN